MMTNRLLSVILTTLAVAALFSSAGCKGGAGGSDVSPAAFRSDPSKMTPEAKRLMEESMRSARQAPKPPVSK
ncbi:MAG: hypothetical protein V4671_10375 [Armatimonadota bacterium]